MIWSLLGMLSALVWLCFVANGPRLKKRWCEHHQAKVWHRGAQCCYCAGRWDPPVER